jgi:hypothetical protein
MGQARDDHHASAACLTIHVDGAHRDTGTG